MQEYKGNVVSESAVNPQGSLSESLVHSQYSVYGNKVCVGLCCFGNLIAQKALRGHPEKGYMACWPHWIEMHVGGTLPGKPF